MSPKGSSSKAKLHLEGYAYTLGEKTIILNVYDNLMKRNPQFTENCCIKNTSELTGCSYASIRRFLRERQATGTLNPPKKPTGSSKRGIVLDDHQKCLVKTIVRDFLIRNEVPSVAKVLKEVSKMDEIPTMGRTKLHEILKEIRFEFE